MQNWFLFKDKPVNSAILRRILHVELKKKLKFLMKVKQPQLEKPACNFFLCYLLTFWNMDQAKWFDPHSFDFMDWKLVNDGDHERVAEHRFSMALSVVKDLAIFSSSKVIKAF